MSILTSEQGCCPHCGAQYVHLLKMREDAIEALRASLRDVQAKVEFEQKLNIDNTAAYCVQIDGLQAQLAALQERCERLERALNDIIDPIEKIKREIPEGHALDGYWAMKLSEDHTHLKSIARAALAATAPAPVPHLVLTEEEELGVQDAVAKFAAIEAELMQEEALAAAAPKEGGG